MDPPLERIVGRFLGTNSVPTTGLVTQAYKSGLSRSNRDGWTIYPPILCVPSLMKSDPILMQSFQEINVYVTSSNFLH